MYHPKIRAVILMTDKPKIKAGTKTLAKFFEDATVRAPDFSWAI
jgi:hypothetical protein